ncbi:bifunctional lysine-specific demethylase and histidyl-hydroxylase [Raphidocelis subcapitata]|uniref:Bifunctional lysine-specific demethylase and histidyl-hydroxylase n=1 Tax=Raphidocelis subcapitata TaxID=307507 RepID=A0A2V0NZM3_9CHLO|nr:bifunctional lysine-specific demethylase and histidyl-hydroxylase [Raphidocelis subcapitata]|eukprot:GBF91033.1 bifunctional lysine-specific demethylase and histidyl-hydroxylase [Raphidocelis subcapitata]
MGKKKDKAAAREAAATAFDWAAVDRDPVGFLVAPETSAAFFADCWERRPRLFKATPARATLAARLTTLPTLLAWLAAAEAADGGRSPLRFGRDVNAARYQNGVRETPNGVGDAAAEELKTLHDEEGCTLQIHQPQRWEDATWRLMAALECQLGQLVGANAYLTPPGTQGLAPHHDDVELWIIQTAGTKRWRCYAPLEGFELPSLSSGDLPQEMLGEPVLEAVLRPGDVLYMPRGTIHQAVADGAAASAHVTVSTAQRASYGDLAMHLFGTALAAQSNEAERALPLAARRGPPPGLPFSHSLERVLSSEPDAGPTPAVVAALAGVLREVAEALEERPDMLTAAVQSSSADFWRHRLPPHPQQLPPQGPPPELGDSIWLRARGWCCAVPHDGPPPGGDEGGGDGGDGGGGGAPLRVKVKMLNQGEKTGPEEEKEEEEEEEEEAEEEEEGPPVKLVTCFHNSREAHMMGPSGGESSDGGESDLFGSDDEGGSGEGDDDGDEPPQLVALAGGSGDEGGEGAPDAAGAGAGEAGGDGDSDGGSGSGSEEDGGRGGCGEGCGHDHGHGHGHGSDLGSSDLEGSGSGDEGDGEGEGEEVPGLLIPGSHMRALMALMEAEAPDKAVPIRSLPLRHDADKLFFAFSMWAEGFAATKRGGGGGGKKGGGGGGGGGGKKGGGDGGGGGGGGKKGGKAARGAGGAAAGAPPAKKAKKGAAA